MSMNAELLRNVLHERKEPAYRLKQAKQAYFVGLAEGWDQVTVFGKELRDACSAAVPWSEVTPVTVQESKESETVKTLFNCFDDKKIESVLMRHEDERNTVCVSSQVGCAMGCAFCATGTMKFSRNLKAGEMIDQVMHYVRWLHARGKGERVSNVVMMGMGEPFHNYDNVLSMLHTLNDADGLNIGARRMSISTCGIVPGILRLADEGFQVNLAISLHSGLDEVRSKIMPVNKVYPLPKLMEAVRTYMEKTNRKVMFEYLLLKGINDRPQDAIALARLFGNDKRLVHVNLIKYHQTEAFQPTNRESRLEFLDRLQDLGIPATHRITFGEDIDAACGQLAVKEAQGKVMQGITAVRASRTPSS